MLVVTIVALLALATVAQSPIEPLRRPEEKPGSYSWRVGLGYTPYGASGIGVDEHGAPYEFIRLAHEFRFLLSGTVQISPELKMGVELVDISTAVEEKRTYLHGTEELSFTKEALGYSVFWEWRMDPRSPWDPRVSLSFGEPWRSGIKASASLLRDPVVLVGELGLHSREEEPPSWFTVALATGFVANAWIRLGVSTGLAVPISGAGLPRGSVGIRMIYALDAKETGAIEVRVSMTTGEETWLSLEVSGRWQGP
ncbi:hypothetical protein LR090_05490 [Candidatus Bipolaricaulota bacterium]|nr:hypothetical protein [Candidatus Bipolaricaulota bacterium]